MFGLPLFYLNAASGLVGLAAALKSHMSNKQVR